MKLYCFGMRPLGILPRVFSQQKTPCCAVGRKGSRSFEILRETRKK